MDTVAIRMWRELFDEALKQSPHDPSANGFGFGMGTLVVICGLCLAGFVVVFLDNRRRAIADNKERVVARKRLEDGIRASFDELKRDTREGFARLDAESVKVQDQYVELRERLARLEASTDRPKGK